ncbi:MAG: hypothetical protein H6741_19240, partial [Alphaproteobacteria bacterium]|nr:hypothetical protein [Alphaproteobacteria bacterium]
MVALLGWLLTVSPALGADIVVLELDGFGVPYEDAALAAEGLRRALDADRRHRPVDPYDLSDRLTEGHRGDLEQARDLLRDARRDLDRGNADTALARLNDCLDLHLAAGSDIVRRGELADVYTFIGIALIELGAGEGAVEPFFQAERLYPGYLLDRAPPMSGYARELFEQARDERMAGPRYSRSVQELDDIARAAGADAILTGYIEADGTVRLRLVEDGRLTGEVSDRVRDLPPYPGDPIYETWINELLGSSGGAREPAPRPEPARDARSSRDDRDSRDSRDDRSRDEPPPREPRRDEVDELDDLEELAAARSQRDDKSKRSRQDEDRIDGASSRPPKASNNKRWLLVAGGAVLAGGAVTGAVVAANAAGGEATTELSPRYTVVLEKSASSAG